MRASVSGGADNGDGSLALTSSSTAAAAPHRGRRPQESLVYPPTQAGWKGEAQLSPIMHSSDLVYAWVREQVPVIENSISGVHLHQGTTNVRAAGASVVE